MPKQRINKPYASLTWDELADLVKAIIASRQVVEESDTQIGATRTYTRKTRPLRFREFCAEIAEKYGPIYHCVNNGTEPSPKTRKKIVTWCEKNAKHISKSK